MLSRGYGILKHIGSWITSTTTDKVIYCSKESKSKNESDHEPVAIYCIHGTCDRNNSFLRIAEYIKDGLNPAVKTIHLVSFEGRGQLNSIEFYAKQLKNKIILNGHKKVILMGHSRGTLVAGFFNEFLAKENGIDVLLEVNVCGPFRGTNWAVRPFTCSKSVSQMRTDSIFLKDLNEKMHDSKSNYLFVSGGKDILVSSEQAYPETHKRKVKEFPQHNHLSIMSSRTLAGVIKDEINQTLQPAAVAEIKPIPSSTMLVKK